MKIKEVKAREIYDSRKDKTIQIIVKTKQGAFVSSAPSGKSKGKFEANPYMVDLKRDINFINSLLKKNLYKLNIEEFNDLMEVEGLFSGIGANSLFALESSILKALAKEQKKELWEFLSRGNPKKIPMPVGNTIGGGLHTQLDKKPDFQEFLFIPKLKRFSDAVYMNKKAYELAGKMLRTKKRNDEGAWMAELENEEALEVMKKVQGDIGKELNIGLDVAASTFFKDGFYKYKNKNKVLDKKEQIIYMTLLSKSYNLLYIEDPLEEQDFSGFSELNKKTRSLIIGDDLTVTNLTRLKKAMQNNSINAIIVKPNQNGSLLKVKEICEFCNKKDIEIVFSHRSGETMDNTISDLSIAWKADFIKTGIYGKEREVKLKRLIKIEEKI